MGENEDKEQYDGNGGEEEAEKEAARPEEAAGEKLTELELKTREAAENLDRYLRKCADFDNYKRRSEREKADIRTFANEELIREFLPLADNLSRALEHFKEEHKDGAGIDSLQEGVELTLKGLFSMLKKFGLEEIEAVGKKFDPNVHEAIGHEDGEEGTPSETVIKQLQKGFMLKGRLLRPALVIVSK